MAVNDVRYVVSSSSCAWKDEDGAVDDEAELEAEVEEKDEAEEEEEDDGRAALSLAVWCVCRRIWSSRPPRAGDDTPAAVLGEAAVGDEISALLPPPCRACN